MSADCIFCRIIAGDADAQVVWSDDLTLAFLDARPVFHGHCLLVPREHHETLGDLPDGLVAPVFQAAKLIARAVQDATGADGTFVAMNNRVSQSVPHLHVHVVPRRRKDGLRGFFWPRQRYESDTHMAEVAAQVREAAARLSRPEKRGAL